MSRPARKQLRLLALMALLVLAAPTSGSPPPTYSLSYNWAVGQRRQYSIYINGQVSTGQGSVRALRAQFTDLWEVLDRDKVNGLYKVAETDTNFSGSDFDLRSYGLPPRGERVERMIDSYGRVAKVAHYTEGSRYYLIPLVLPQVAVKEGGRWKMSQGLRAPVFESEVLTEVVLVYTFEEVVKNYKGRKRDCARIRVDANYRYQAEDGNSGVTGAFQGRIFFDLVEHKVVDYQITENRREWSKPDNRNRTTSIQVTSISHL